MFTETSTVIPMIDRCEASSMPHKRQAFKVRLNANQEQTSRNGASSRNDIIDVSKWEDGCRNVDMGDVNLAGIGG